MPTKRQKHTMRAGYIVTPFYGKSWNTRGGNIGLALGRAIATAVPNWKRQLVTQLGKDALLRVGLPIAAAVGTKKLYKHHKKK